MDIKKLVLLGGFILLPLLVGAISGYATASSVTTWYAELVKPSFSPPNWLFAPVWTILYLLMGISAFLIFRSPASADRLLSLDLFFVQLAFNFSWSWVFFWFQSPGFAVVNIIVLLILILLMVHRYYKVNKLAALLQIPYLCWILFATMLNSAVWYLN